MERGARGEKESIWNSRLFKVGFVMAIVGAAAGLAELAATGVIVTGAGWAFGKGKA